MGKSILYKLFGLGRIPQKARPALEAEGVELVDEGISCWCTTRNFRSPRGRSVYRKEGFAGSLEISKQRVIFVTFGIRQISEE